MAYIQGYGQQWQSDPSGGGMSSYNATSKPEPVQSQNIGGSMTAGKTFQDTSGFDAMSQDKGMAGDLFGGMAPQTPKTPTASNPWSWAASDMMERGLKPDMTGKQVPNAGMAGAPPQHTYGRVDAPEYGINNAGSPTPITGAVLGTSPVGANPQYTGPQNGNGAPPSPTDLFGNFNPAYAQYMMQQARSRIPPQPGSGNTQGSAGTAGSAGTSTQPNQPNFGGLAATPGGQMTFNGQQYVAGANGQWTPAQQGSPQGQGQQGGYAPPAWLPQQGIQGQAGGTDMNGAYTLNNRNFASLDQANALAKQLGGNVVSTNYEDDRTPEYNIDMGRGSPLNAGQLAYYYGPNSSFAGIRDPADREAAIRRSIEDELKYNDSPMERQVADKRDQFSSFKDTPGGFSSGVRTGSGAGSLGPSFWDGSPQMPWQQNAGPAQQAGFAGGLKGAPGTVGDAGSNFYGGGSGGGRPQGGGQGQNPYAGTGGPIPGPDGDQRGGQQGGQNQLMSLLQMLGLGGGGSNLSSLAGFLNGGGADFGAQTAGSRGFQRRPYLPGYGGGLGYGARFSNQMYYPQFGM